MKCSTLVKRVDKYVHTHARSHARARPRESTGGGASPGETQTESRDASSASRTASRVPRATRERPSRVPRSPPREAPLAARARGERERREVVSRQRLTTGHSRSRRTTELTVVRHTHSSYMHPVIHRHTRRHIYDPWSPHVSQPVRPSEVSGLSQPEGATVWSVQPWQRPSGPGAHWVPGRASASSSAFGVGLT